MALIGLELSISKQINLKIEGAIEESTWSRWKVKVTETRYMPEAKKIQEKIEEKELKTINYSKLSVNGKAMLDRNIVICKHLTNEPRCGILQVNKENYLIFEHNDEIYYGIVLPLQRLEYCDNIANVNYIFMLLDVYFQMVYLQQRSIIGIAPSFSGFCFYQSSNEIENKAGQKITTPLTHISILPLNTTESPNKLCQLSQTQLEDLDLQRMFESILLFCSPKDQRAEVFKKLKQIKTKENFMAICPKAPANLIEQAIAITKKEFTIESCKDFFIDQYDGKNLRLAQNYAKYIVVLQGDTRLLGYIAKGSFGEVHLYKDESYEEVNGLVAAKSMIQKTQDKIEQTQQEIRLLRSVQEFNNNTNVIQCVKSLNEQDELLICLPFCLSIDEYLKRIISSKKIEEVYNIFRGSATGLYCLNQNKVCHRDIKPDNIMIYITSSGEAVPKIIDLNVSKNASSGTFLKTLAGTEITMAPEILAGEQENYGYNVDTWSIGVTFFQLFTGIFPFKDPSQEKKMVDIPIFLPYCISSILQKCLIFDPKKRKCIEPSWFKDYDGGLYYLNEPPEMQQSAEAPFKLNFYKFLRSVNFWVKVNKDVSNPDVLYDKLQQQKPFSIIQYNVGSEVIIKNSLDCLRFTVDLYLLLKQLQECKLYLEDPLLTDFVIIQQGVTHLILNNLKIISAKQNDPKTILKTLFQQMDFSVGLDEIQAFLNSQKAFGEFEKVGCVAAVIQTRKHVEGK